MSDYPTPGDRLRDIQLLDEADPRMKRRSAALEVLEDERVNQPCDKPESGLPGSKKTP